MKEDHNQSSNCTKAIQTRKVNSHAVVVLKQNSTFCQTIPFSSRPGKRTDYKKQPRRISIPTTDGLQFMNIDDIIYLEASNNYTTLFVAGNVKYMVCRTLKDFEDILPVETFLRIHHSTIINKNYVEKYIRGEGGQVVMQNGKLLDVSKRKKSQFLLAINQ